MAQKFKISKDEAIAQVAAELDGPVTLAEFVRRVLVLWPSQAKKPETAVRQTIRDYHAGKTVIFMDDETVWPVSLALAGVTLRVPLARSEIKNGLFHIYPALEFFLPQEFSPDEVQLVDENDHTIPVELVTRRKKVRSLFGEYEQEIHSWKLGWWYRKRKVKKHHNILVTVLDWAAGKFRLQPESQKEYRSVRNETAQSNRQLADIIFDLLENSRDDSIYSGIAIPTAYARLQRNVTHPPNYWRDVIESDPRLRYSGFGDIRYADSYTMIDRLMLRDQEERPSSPPKKLSATEKQQVYTFKAAYKQRKGLWRRIEIQGGQTLYDFDRILRQVFKRDTIDHMSGFWRLVRRGSSRRFREVDLGSITPFGEGDAGGKKIAALDLQPGDKLKYVYDFGDWYEYIIELEKIAEPEEDAKYPRVIAQNRPRYHYCPSCAEQGRKTVARYVCYDCSDWETPVWVCEDCIYPDHEDHYLQEIVY
ncbi:MAG TPA: hypothetical protein ENJ93_03375 [Chloroflexi bacterium]|nr:hypothetical protein [Chloroflexota bacterium]